MEEPPSKKHEKKRLHSILPPPVAPDWRSEVDALADVEDGLATTLWRGLRNVREWAEASGEARAELFPEPTAAVRERYAYAMARAPELMEALSVFVLLAGNPTGVEGRQLAWACDRVRAWAEERSLMLTALHFAETAALADPESPARANAAARMCRRAAKQDRASMWYERAFRLAARHRSRRESLHALLGYGTLLHTQGRFEDARKTFKRAVRRATRFGRRRQVTDAHHDLLLLNIEDGRLGEAMEQAQAAVKICPRGHVRFPYLVHDIALLLVRHHQYVRAMLLLERLIPALPRPSERVLVWGTLAWAAASAGYPDRYDAAEGEVVRLAAVYEEHAAAALLYTAKGARVLRRPTRAAALAKCAAEIADRRRDRAVARDVKVFFEGPDIPPKIGVADALEDEACGWLFRQASRRLRKWSAPG